MAARNVRIVAVAAPAGYGKSTALAQWAERDPRPTAWLTLDRCDDDPVHLVSEIAEAMVQAGLLRTDGLDAKEPGGSASWRLVRQLVLRLDTSRPGMLVLDQAEVLETVESRDTLGELARTLPETVTLVVASRKDIPFPLGVLRSQSEVTELSAEDLAMSIDEARELVEGFDVGYDDEQVAALHRHTEGWPVGMYLSLLAAASGRETVEPLGIHGDDRYLGDYLRSEVIDPLSPSQRSFLERSAVLDELSGPLCDFVLERTQSQQVLEDLAAANSLIVPLDRCSGRFRYHRLLSEFLVANLARREPALVARLHQRASLWFEQRDMPIEAVRHAMAADDPDRVADLLAAHAQPIFDGGGMATVNRWFAWFDADDRSDRYPEIALMAALANSARGDPVAAERWKAAAARGRDRLGPMAPVARLADALFCVHGIDQMLADAQQAQRVLPADSDWYATAVAVEGLALLWNGMPGPAEERLELAAETGRRYQSFPTAVYALATLAILALGRGALERAEELATHAQGLVEHHQLEAHATSTLPFVAGARCMLRHGEPLRAQRTLHRAYGLRPALSISMPGIALHTMLEMVDAAIELADITGARQVLREASRIVEQRPLGHLEERYRNLKDLLAALPTGKTGVATLTTAELRVLPYLRTHLSFPEIGERLFLSRHTVKTQALSIYRKLGASTRSEAVAEALRMGLLDNGYP